MDGAPNLRQLGGYETIDGRQVNWGKFFRSGELSQLSDADLDIVKTLDIALSMDFRDDSEQLKRPNRFPESWGIQKHSLPISPGGVKHYKATVASSNDTQKTGITAMTKSYGNIVSTYAHRYQQMFELILNQQEGAIHFNCAAGKDRTGIAAVLILEVLGVPSQTILDDYLLTSQYFVPMQELQKYADYFDSETIDVEGLLPLFSINETYLDNAYAVIDEQYQGMSAYLTDVLKLGNVEIKELRNRYLINC